MEPTCGRSFPLIVASVIAACAPSVQSATFFDAAPRRDAADVRVFQHQRPVCEYHELGIVAWQPRHALDELSDGVDAMRARAAQMGGDAIVDFEYHEQPSGSSTQVAVDSSDIRVRARIEREPQASGTVIRYTGPGCGPTAEATES